MNYDQRLGRAYGFQPFTVINGRLLRCRLQAPLLIGLVPSLPLSFQSQGCSVRFAFGGPVCHSVLVRGGMFHMFKLLGKIGAGLKAGLEGNFRD